jgi:ATP-dependent Clp protease ATP-binding subunit ClpX
MIDLMYDLPSIEGEKRITVTRDAVVKQEKPEIQVLKKSA